MYFVFKGAVIVRIVYVREMNEIVEQLTEIVKIVIDKLH